jgi:thiol-disulfide isomerase/thioredoxin
MIAPILDEIAVEQAGKLKVAKLNVDENPDIARRFDVMSIPTLIVFKDGQPAKRMVGAKGKGGEGSEQAATANRFDAEVYVGLSSLASGPGSVAFYAVDGFHSVGGRRLAELVVGAVQLAVPALEVAPRGMRLPVLRETRMPAIVAELGPSRLVRDNLPRVSDALAAAIGQWAESPS